MSTRKATPGEPLRQERFVSSTALRKGILANITARRVERLPSAADRELIWWLQEQSSRRIGAPHPTCTSFDVHAAGRVVVGASSMEQLAHDLCARFPDRVTGKAGRAARELPAFFARLCLDPKTEPQSASVGCFRDIIPAMRTFKAEREAAHLAHVAPTSVTCAVWEGLDFGLSQRGIVLLEGTYRSGKSYSAQSWCLARPGRARYVSLPAYADDTTFFRTLAVALGTAASAQRKAIEMRLRVEDALRSRDLMLVIDEAENCLPAAARPTGAPERLKWLMSLDNAGVAVALVASRNFGRIISSFEKRYPAFGFEQWWGRISLRKQLPDSLSESDLFAIAERLAPDADAPTRMLLVGHTLTAQGRVAALEKVVKRARFTAESAGRVLTFDDVEAAILESAPPSMVSRPRPQPSISVPTRHLIASVPRTARRPAAEPLQPNRLTL